MSDQPVRAEIPLTGSPYIKSARITIDAPAADIFAILVNPHRHHEFDGSGTVRPSVSGPDRLKLGDRFTVAMKVGVPYRVTSTVKEFEVDRLIAWSHLGGHRWRYELRPIDDVSTEVTETFDGSYSRFPPALNLINAPENNQKAVAATLVRLKELCESSAPTG